MHVVGTAGHVDHGKSTLVRALTGIDPDRFAEEKRRGLTIDLGFAWFTLPSGRQVGIVDVPGHERFIRNMLAGVGAIDAAIFVVAADEGWMPQSAEHLQILDFLGISGGVVVLTKADLVEPDELEIVWEDTWQRLRGTSMHDAPIVALSAETGAGLDEFRSTLDDVLAMVPEAADHGRPRLFVDRSFTIAGAGTVVTGTLSGGSLHVSDEVEIVPTGTQARIRSLQTHKRSVDEAVPGSRVAANLVGLERTEITRGDALVRHGQWIVTRSLAARLEASTDLVHPLTARGAYELYLGTADFRCRLKFLEDADTNDAIVPVNTPSGLAPGLRPGGSALVQLFYGRGLPVGVGDTFVLRDVGRRETVAGGVVLDQAPGDIKRGDRAQLKRLHARETLRGRELADRIVSERGAIRTQELAALAGTETTGADGYVIDPGYEAGARESVLARVSAFHTSQPLEAGMPIESLRDVAALDVLLERWIAEGLLARAGSAVRLPDHGSTLTADQRVEADRALEKLRASGASPPPLGDIGLAHDLARALERGGELVLLNPEIAFPSDVWHGIERRVVELITAEGPATVSQVRDAIGTSRKFAVPILERLDASGVTRRKGDIRELGPRGRELANTTSEGSGGGT